MNRSLKKAALLCGYVLLSAVVGSLLAPVATVGWASAVVFGLLLGGLVFVSGQLDKKVKTSSFGEAKVPLGVSLGMVLAIYCGLPIAAFGLLHLLAPGLLYFPTGFDFVIAFVGAPLLLGAWLQLIDRLSQ